MGMKIAMAATMIGYLGLLGLFYGYAVQRGTHRSIGTRLGMAFGIGGLVWGLVVTMAVPA